MARPGHDGIGDAKEWPGNVKNCEGKAERNTEWLGYGKVMQRVAMERRVTEEQ